MIFLEYPKCTTCKKAKKFLNDNKLNYTDRNIKDNNPTYDELKSWYKKSGFPLKKFFNTSGLLYKSMQLKDKLADMTEEEQLKLLSSDGMLVKRPLVITDNSVIIGFKTEEWKKQLLK